MTNLSNIIDDLPRMMSGDELIAELKVLPEYNPGICSADAPLRLMALSDLYRVYIPSQMSLEIYSKLYLALLSTPIQFCKFSPVKKCRKVVAE